MPLEKSAGAVIFRRDKGKTYYLLLHYPTGSRTAKDYWDFPKGHIEKGEKSAATARREVGEETGLIDIKFIKGFKKWIKYSFRDKGKIIFKTVTFYLIETKNKNVKISFEHSGYQWLLYQKALEQLTFKNAKEILEKANDFISEKDI